MMGREGESMFIYHYSRYYVRDTDEYDSLEEVFRRADGDMESEQAWPIKITDGVGRVLYEHHLGRGWIQPVAKDEAQ